MAEHTRRLPIQQLPAQAIGPAVEILAKWFDPDCLRLSGGTALEARWHHRSSTDLDFFVHKNDSNHIFASESTMLDILKALQKLSRKQIFTDDDDNTVSKTSMSGLKFYCDHVPVTLTQTEGFHGDPRDECEEQTGIFFCSNVDILVKKMYNRLIFSRIITERDAYDFVVARTMDPQSLSAAWDTLDLTDSTLKSQIVSTYKELTYGRAESVVVNDQNLEAPVYQNIADNLWNYAWRMFDSDLRYVPALK